MARSKADDDATKNPRREHKTQIAPRGTKIGLRKKGEVLGEFRKIAKCGT